MNPPPPAPPPAIPDYELLRVIGRGSYGEVWLARSVTGVFRVIKIVRRDRFEDERPYQRELEGISRFQATASGRPRQLALLHVGRNDVEGYFYYVMEPADDVETGSAIDPERYVPLTLRELFRRRGRLPAEECVHLALELARGLSVLHEAGLIHRDIKPSNIIFVQRVPKLADVGLVTSTEASKTCAGTPGYAPLEGAGTVAADLFSLGKVLYEITTGFDRMEFPRVPPELADGPDAPLIREINAVVLRACDPEPLQRHPSAEVLARDLELIQAGRSVAFYETLRKRLRAAAFAAGAVAILAALGATLFIWRAHVLENANDQTRRALYRSDLAVAQLARSSGDLGRARAALLRQVPAPGQSDLRGLEWSILAHSVRGEGTPLEPTTNGVAVRQLFVDDSGRWAAGGLADDTAAIWDLQTGRIVRYLPKVNSLGGFTHDGLLVVDEPARALRFESPMGGTIRRWETGKRLRSLLTDGRTVVSPPTEHFQLSILSEGISSNTPTIDVTAYWPNHVVSCASISPDGRLASVGMFQQDGARRTRILTSIDLLRGKPIWHQDVPGRVIWTRISNQRNHILANIGGLQPSLYSAEAQNELAKLEGHSARVQDASFSPSDRYIATASADQTVKIWESSTGRELRRLDGMGRPLTSVAWFHDETKILAGDDAGGVRSFEFSRPDSRESLSGLYADVHGDIAFGDKGSLIAATVTTNSIAIVDVVSLSIRHTISNVFQPIAFEAADQRLIAYSSDWSVKRVDLLSNEEELVAAFIPRDTEVRSFAFDSSRSEVALSSSDGRFYLFNWRTKQVLSATEPAKSPVWALAFSPTSDELWTGSENGSICRWSLRDLQQIGRKLELHADLQSAALSCDGRWAAFSVVKDATVRIYDIAQARWVARLNGHRRFVQTLNFTTDSKRLISGGADGRLIVWSLPDFEEIASFEVESSSPRTGDEGIAAIRLSPSDSGIAALTEDGRIQLWRTR